MAEKLSKEDFIARVSTVNAAVSSMGKHYTYRVDGKTCLVHRVEAGTDWEIDLDELYTIYCKIPDEKITTTSLTVYLRATQSPALALMKAAKVLS